MHIQRGHVARSMSVLDKTLCKGGASPGLQAAQSCQEIWDACLKEQAHDYVLPFTDASSMVQGLGNPPAERMYLCSRGPWKCHEGMLSSSKYQKALPTGQVPTGLPFLIMHYPKRLSNPAYRRRHIASGVVPVPKGLETSMPQHGHGLLNKREGPLSEPFCSKHS